MQQTIKSQENTVAWFSSPKMGIVWLGYSKNNYPNSFKLENIAIDLWLLNEPEIVAKEITRVNSKFTLNPHYYHFDTSLKWLDTENL